MLPNRGVDAFENRNSFILTGRGLETQPPCHGLALRWSHHD